MAQDGRHGFGETGGQTRDILPGKRQMPYTSCVPLKT
ncbi:hypothetical protein SAMN04487787_102134 [Kosakonia sacchari]|nr:hypothetical protein SAMN04487787_102134 [Kosakonia sacchari]